MNLAALVNREETGIMQKLVPVENDIVKKGKQFWNVLKNEGFDQDAIIEFYDWLDEKVIADYNKLFGI